MLLFACGIEIDELFFDAGGNDNGFGTLMFGGELAHLGNERMTVGIGLRVGELVFGNVAGVDRLLRGK